MTPLTSAEWGSSDLERLLSSGPAVSVAGDSLSGFKSAVIFQKVRDAGRNECGE
jgi:hypothetical protein